MIIGAAVPLNSYPKLKFDLTEAMVLPTWSDSDTILLAVFIDEANVVLSVNVRAMLILDETIVLL